MKNKINSTPHDKSDLIKASSDGNDARGQLLKLGLDVDLRNIAVALQCERGRDWAGLEVFPRATHRLGEAEERIRLRGARGVGVLRLRLHVARRTDTGRSALHRDHARASGVGAAAQERSDGYARVVRAAVALSRRAQARIKSDSHSEPSRATAPGAGAAT